MEIISRAVENGRKYGFSHPLFRDTIWDDNFDTIVNNCMHFILAINQSNVYELLYRFCQSGYRIKGSVRIKDGPVWTYGLELQYESCSKQNTKGPATITEIEE